MCKDRTVRALCSVTLGRLITILCWGAYIAAMAAEATAQAIVRAKLVDSPLSECSTLRVNDLVDE